MTHNAYARVKQKHTLASSNLFSNLKGKTNESHNSLQNKCNSKPVHSISLFFKNRHNNGLKYFFCDKYVLTLELRLNFFFYKCAYYRLVYFSYDLCFFFKSVVSKWY